jgi:hypothetical protein
VARGGIDRFQGEPAVHRAVPAPQDDPRSANLFAGQPSGWLVRVEDDAVRKREAELAHCGVAAQVLVGQEEHLAHSLNTTVLVKRPLHSGFRVARRADGAAVTPCERLDGS